MIATRLAFYYVAVYGTVGVLLPFWPVWLQYKGLDATQIGIVLAAATIGRVVANPLIAQTADRRGERRPIIVKLAAVTVAASFAFFLTDGFWPIIVVALVFFAAWSAMQPLAESLTMLNVRAHGFQYGRVRLWGSIAFIVTAIGAGEILGLTGEAVVLPMIVGAVAFTLVVVLFLPATTVAPSTTSGGALRPLLANGRFLAFLGAAALIQSSHAVYYGFATIHWRAAGYGDTLIGALWAEGVVAEIVLFALAGGLVGRLGPVGLVALGAAAGLARWIAVGLGDALALLVVVQALHAFTFGATHLGVIHYISQHVPVERSATAQSLYSAVVMGLASGLAASASGWLYGNFAAHAFFAMAAMCAIGGLLAFLVIGAERKAA